MKGLRYTKIVKEIKIEEVSGKLEAKTKIFPETIIHKIFEANSSFHMKWLTMGRH